MGKMNIVELVNCVWDAHNSIISLPWQSYNAVSINDTGEELNARFAHPSDHRLLVPQDNRSPEYSNIFGRLSQNNLSQNYMYYPTGFEVKAAEYEFFDWRISFSWGSEGHHEYTPDQTLDDIFAYIIRESKSSYCAIGICHSEPSTHTCVRGLVKPYEPYSRKV